ncbi:ATP-binding protein [Streptomyces sp. SID3212]|uniref:AAA family ATPase n=1 Tax=Streptomyces sp. SID3212 TaxID=2690259 RepID=UPI00136D6240|nr:ATP-binding protein [Streptomyces sp. SID3212]MYV56201.1 AAA family ATPase [Streptomyces sp. SID3212]
MAATPFVGRSTELGLLRKRLDRVVATGSGRALTVRGRRQVGKSRLVQEFCDRAAVPYVFFSATKGAPTLEALAAFHTELRTSSLGNTDPTGDTGAVIPTSAPTNWPDAFRLLSAALAGSPAAPGVPSVVVLDELPWLAEQDSVFDGALQTAWDRLLARQPVLLLLLGSDLHMMERLTAYDRPFYGRADNLVLGPLSPAETGSALGLDAADAIDAHLVSGGLPGVLRAWPHGTPALAFLEAECADPASPVFGVPEATLMAEFPAPDQARQVLEAVGSGDRTHANIAATAGSQSAALPSGVLSPLLRKLSEEKRVLAVDHPLSDKPGKPALHRVADSNLRLYLAALRAAQEQTRRGRPEAAFRVIERRWAAWRGRAVEPLIRESLALAAGTTDFPWPETEAVGGWWNRRFDPEIDLIGTDRAPVARTVFFAGSVKWLNTPFDHHDLVTLKQSAAQVPGYTEGPGGLVIATLNGTTGLTPQDGVHLVWRPHDVVAAWPV